MKPPQEAPFTQLRDRATAYLDELAILAKKGKDKNKPFDASLKDEIGFAQFLIEVGLAITWLTPEEAAMLEGMCSQIERAHAQLETVAFKRKHPGS